MKISKTSRASNWVHVTVNRQKKKEKIRKKANLSFKYKTVHLLTLSLFDHARAAQNLLAFSWFQESVQLKNVTQMFQNLERSVLGLQKICKYSALQRTRRKSSKIPKALYHIKNPLIGWTFRSLYVYTHIESLDVSWFCVSFFFERFLTGVTFCTLKIKMNRDSKITSIFLLEECCLIDFYLGTLTEAVLLSWWAWLIWVS